MIARKYTISTKVLGSGNFGKVFLGYNMANPDFKVAMKTMPKTKLEDLELIKEEIKILN